MRAAPVTVWSWMSGDTRCILGDSERLACPCDYCLKMQTPLLLTLNHTDCCAGSRFFLSMQLVAGKVQRRYRQSKTLNLHTAVETPGESVKDETKRDRGKASGSLLNT
ncbi:unnamed protein product [Arctogadus glacialis]